MPKTVGYPVKLTKRAAGKYVDAVKDAKSKLRIGQDYRRSEREHKWESNERQYLGDHWDMMDLDAPTSDLARRWGPIVEVDPRFPQRTNVQFLRALAPDLV